jgi:hypothetical protein
MNIPGAVLHRFFLGAIALDLRPSLTENHVVQKPVGA